MNHNYRIESSRLILSPLVKKDIEPLRILRNSNRRSFLNSGYIEKEAQEKWFCHYLQKDNDFMFSVALKSDPDTFIGSAALYDFSADGKVCEFGRIMIDKALAPCQGIGTEVTVLSCALAFDILNVNKIVLYVLESNIRARHIYSTAGFKLIEEQPEEILYWELSSNDLNRGIIEDFGGSITP